MGKDWELFDFQLAAVEIWRKESLYTIYQKRCISKLKNVSHGLQYAEFVGPHAKVLRITDFQPDIGWTVTLISQLYEDRIGKWILSEKDPFCKISTKKSYHP